MKRWQKQTPKERFYAHTQISPDCWQWTAGKKKAGYGQFTVDGKKVIAHRWAYLNFVGSIPDGYEVDHTCNNPSCVNPKHLEAVTLQENRRRRKARKTRCPRGHIYDEANTRLQGDQDGYYTRVCRTCENARSKAKYLARSAN